ncbi:MAG: hypothetical protein AAGA60_29955 [Cyanobacteria bacterium P01_E01_bin.42]
MQVTVTPEQERFVRSQIQSGHYWMPEVEKNNDKKRDILSFK